MPPFVTLRDCRGCSRCASGGTARPEGIEPSLAALEAAVLPSGGHFGAFERRSVLMSRFMNHPYQFLPSPPVMGRGGEGGHPHLFAPGDEVRVASTPVRSTGGETRSGVGLVPPIPCAVGLIRMSAMTRSTKTTTELRIIRIQPKLDQMLAFTGEVVCHSGPCTPAHHTYRVAGEYRLPEPPVAPCVVGVTIGTAATVGLTGTRRTQSCTSVQVGAGGS